MDNWELSDAAERLEEVIDWTQHQGPQGIRRDSQLVAVVVSIKTYVALKQAHGLVEHFRDLAVMGLDFEPVRARAARFERGRVYIELSDGREIGAPLDWYPFLGEASPDVRERWELEPGGLGVFWPDLMASLEVVALLHVQGRTPHGQG